MNKAWIFALLALGCGANREPPATYADDLPPAEVSEHDPVRADYRELLLRCERRRDDAERAARDSERRYGAETAVATVAVIAGEAASARDPSDVPLDGVGGQGLCPNPSDPHQSGPCIQGTPQVTVAGPGPAGSEVESARADVNLTVDRINRAIQDADEFLFAHPEAETWSADEREEWGDLRAAVASACVE